MHPAFSVIFLTTLIGAAQGLFLALFTVQSYAAFKLLPPPDAHAFYGQGSLLALALLGAGLVASFFHLGRPERAWRSIAMWRTSWLAREVIVLPAFVGVVFLYGLAHWLNWHPVLMTLPGGLPVDPSAILGVAGTLLAFALFICTAMIYACVKFLREWHSSLTVINYILLGGASGFSLAAAFAVLSAPELVSFLAGWAAIITLLGLVSRAASLHRNARLQPKSTLQTAIGIKHPRIVQKAQGFMGGSFNTREYFHGQPVAVLRGVKWFFMLAVFPLPLLFLLSGMQGGGAGGLLAAAFVVQYAGLVAERWFFFAQTNHPQNLYYQSIA
ncbi:MAG: dimethyl sulfoxide reductase anchor subunit [Sulfuritalea sp.]|jgi:DMSO reductase anchor subunit|nr:dimethyl sulfoxide reductase anchor subunit [Sulfuritalea sp.]